jgi:hypothetical protein
MLDNNLGEPRGKKSRGACFSNLGCPILCFGIHFNTWLNILEGIDFIPSLCTQSKYSFILLIET